ncbi:MAG: hypothetical protein MUF18_09445 [Fimbriiglobus sp.]|nr:hypothetical protein [Fimbriiglobus sp.]
MELRDALSQIAEIRARVAAAERFRGYRAGPVAVTGLVAVVAAALQPLLVPDPAERVTAWLWLWLGTAAVAGAVAGSGIWLRHRRTSDRLTKELTWLAVGQFAPCLVAGAVTTVAVMRFAPQSAALLPGLWQVFFSLGVFASFRLLPPAVAAVGVLYLAAGAVNLGLAAGPHALAPLAMGLPFGLGQLLTAAVLYWNLERTRHDPAR